MPLPAALVSPLAFRLATLGVVAAASWAASRRGPERVDIRSEDALDGLREGADLRFDRHNGRADAEARLTRTVRVGRNGPGLEVDLAGLARLRLRRV